MRATVVTYSGERAGEGKDEQESLKPGTAHNVIDDLGDFSQITSAHGIPHIGASSNWPGRLLWTLLVIACTCAFITQAYWVIEKFMRNERNVNIEVKYMPDGFPAVTICNLNPYKYSLVQEVDSLQAMLSLFINTVEEGDRQERSRLVRQLPSKYEAAYEKCNCGEKELPDADSQADELSSTECYRDMSGSIPRSLEDSVCLCIYEESTDAAWPCHPKSAWNFTKCSECQPTGRCSRGSADTTNATATDKQPPSLPCVCKLDGKHCLAYDPAVGLRRLWEDDWTTPKVITTTTTTTMATPSTTTVNTTTFSSEYKEAMGFSDMTDTVAITTKAKENLMFAMAALPLEQRKRLSYGKHEFIRKCSFNGEQCDIEKDFKIHVDPVYGNCYTFNYDMQRNLTSSKAGPMYGLRVMTYVNISDYLPTSDSGGVRVSIHEKTGYPFPDTFGFNAPTGFISSLGLTIKKVTRMPPPYGDCQDKPNMTGNADFVYDGYEYSTEACYRSCFQSRTVQMCGCADPRFPPPVGTEHCKGTNPIARNCLLEMTSKLGDFHKIKCECRMPCKETVIWAAFSTARWPSGAAKLGSCNGMSVEDCLQDYKEHAASLEVFLEKLSYENLREYEAYGWVNVIADFGGQLGLWLGFSVITCMEFVMLLWHLCSTYCCKCLRGQQAKVKRQPLDL